MGVNEPAARGEVFSNCARSLAINYLPMQKMYVIDY